MSLIVLVVVDGLRADHLGPYGGEGTPSADRLGAEGVVFDNAIAQAPWTRPSMGSVMTGLYPSQHGLVDRVRNVRSGAVSVTALDPGIPTLAELLAAGGTPTAAFLGGNANLKPLFGLTRGFTHTDWRPTTDGEVLVEDFSRWLSSSPPAQGFCYLHFMDVHHPLPDVIPSRLDQGLDLATVSDSMDELMGYYAAAVRKVDRHLARVISALEAAGAYEDALVVLTADHGEELGEHGAMLAHGRTLYRELLRVPLIARLPGAERAGTRISAPVQLIDVMPTLLSHLGRPAPDTPGRDLLPLIRGRAEPPAHAFSELLRRDRYARSVTTERHHLVESFVLEEAPVASAMDLAMGLPVKVEGLPIDGGPFMPTKVSLKREGPAKVRGPVDRVLAEAGALTVLGITFRVAPQTRFVGLDGEEFALADLGVGEIISAAFSPESGGRWPVATTLRRRKGGGKSKVEGTIEDVRDLGAGLRSIRVLGMDIPVDGVGVSASWRDKRPYRSRADALSRVIAGDFVKRRRELFDLAGDPAEERNLVAEAPEVVARLEGALAGWTGSLDARPGAAGASVELDGETIAQLRRMGYVD